VCVCVCGWFRHSSSLRLRLAPKPIRFRISPRQQGSDGPVTYHVSWLPLFLFFRVSPPQQTSSKQAAALCGAGSRHADMFVLGYSCIAIAWRACRAAAAGGQPSSRTLGYLALAPLSLSAHAQRFSLRHRSPLLLGQAPGHLGSPTTVPQLTRPFTPSPSRLYTLPLAASPISQPVQLLAPSIDVVAPSNYMGKCLGP